MDFKPALLFALLAQLSFSYLAMSGDKLSSVTTFQATVEGANYANIPYSLANITAYGRSGEALDFSVIGDKLYFTGGYARITGEYPAWVCDYSYMPRALKGADKDTFIVDICSGGKPVFVDEFTFTGLPADRKILGIVYYPYYAYGSETNVTRLASAENPMYVDVADYAYFSGVLNVKQRLLVNPSNWSNIFLLIFEDADASFAPPQTGQKNAIGDSAALPGGANGFLVPIVAAVAIMAIAAFAWYKHVRK